MDLFQVDLILRQVDQVIDLDLGSGFRIQDMGFLKFVVMLWIITSTECPLVNNVSTDNSWLNVRCGVPQGSILGPLLYLIYVNDIHKSCSTNILSFADDTTLYTSNSNIKQLFSDANKHINDLFKWFCANKLSLNAGKTKYIIIKPKHRKVNLEQTNILINNIQEKATKFLGIFIDENLSWTHHVY